MKKTVDNSLSSLTKEEVLETIRSIFKDNEESLKYVDSIISNLVELKKISDADSKAPEDMELVLRYKIMSIPNMVIIDHNDTVQARFIGYTPSDKIKEAIAKIQENSEGRFVVIEDFNGYISLVADPDSGDTLVFNTSDEAEEEAKKCQNGKVVKL